MQFFTSQHPFDFTSLDIDTESKEEISCGVIVERRVVLGFGLSAMAALFPPMRNVSLGQDPINPLGKPDPGDSYEIEELLVQIRPKARQLIASNTPDEEQYIAMATEELLKLTRLETNESLSSGKNGWEMDFQAFVPPIILYQIRMSPNSIIKLHDHRHHNGALTVREGAIRVRSFDLHLSEGEKTWDIAAGIVPAMGETFLIQEKRELTLKQGQAAGLTRTRENIHQIEAGPDGCLLYDMFTNFKPNAQSFSIEWDGKYSDPGKKLCKVTWIPPDHSHE